MALGCCGETGIADESDAMDLWFLEGVIGIAMQKLHNKFYSIRNFKKYSSSTYIVEIPRSESAQEYLKESEESEKGAE